LEIVLTGLPADFPVPITIVQHMPPIFTRRLAERLASKSAIGVREAQSGESLDPATALIAPGDFHLLIRRRPAGGTAVPANPTAATSNPLNCGNGYVLLNQAPLENSCRPAGDVMFRSAAEAYGNHVLAVVMTGMGQDGLVGCQAVWRAGGKVIAQDESSSVVWGMPGAVARAGLASKILPIDHIGAEIARRVREGRP
jgi:two-component system chemotaxis response regulator CheB